jgi:hypothetical protein
MISLFAKGHQIKFNCGHSFSYPYHLEIGGYNVPLFPCSKLYACHTVDANDDYNTVTGEIIVNKNNPSVWGIKNMSKDSWFMIPANGEEKSIKPGAIVPIASNMSIKFRDIDGKIVKE